MSHTHIDTPAPASGSRGKTAPKENVQPAGSSNAPSGDSGETQLNSLRDTFAALPSASRFTDPEVEAIFRAGLMQLAQGRAEDARGILSLALLYRPLEPRYQHAYGLSQRMLGNAEIALLSFQAAMALDPADPRPALQAAECMFLLDGMDEARPLLQSVLEHSADDPALANLALRARTMLDSMAMATQ
jgi:tetratricopeptide (TPR) repeat protein